jgi:phospholipid/cholesterol/gamma-HCH transport system substrate-binding protein
MSKSERLRAVYLAAFLLVCFAIASYFFKLAGTNIIPAGEKYKVQAVVPTAVSLAKAADVREAGVNVGRVTKLGDRGDTTVLELSIDKKYAPVYRDARVYVRAKSVAGENFVELDPGDKAAGSLPSGALLSINHAEEATQIDQLFSIFDKVRRRDLQRALSGLAAGLPNSGRDLNRTLEAAAAVPAYGNDAMTVLGHDREHVAGLVDSFGRVARALGDRAADIQLFTRQVKVAAQAVAARDSNLRAMLDQLPPFLHQARATGARLTTFSSDATPVVRDLRLAVNDLVPTVRDLLPAAQGGRGMTRELGRFARAATPTFAQLAPFSRTAPRLTLPLAAFLRQGNPFFAYMAPYAKEVATFFALPAASFQATDALGHVARVILPLSRSNLAGALTAEQERQLQKLSGPFDTRGTNAYPAPGRAGDPGAYSGAYPRLEPDPPYVSPR